MSVPKVNGNGSSSGTQVSWVSVGAIIIALTGLFLSIVNPRTDLHDAVIALTSQIEVVRRDSLPKSEHEEFKLRKDKDTDRLQVEINVLRSAFVPREEVQQHWKDAGERLDGLRADFRELQKEFGSSATIGDTIRDLRSQIAKLQDQVNANATAAARIPMTPTSTPPR